MKKILCFDLDGTLLDVRKRYYGLYREATVNRGQRPLSQGSYLRNLRIGMKNFQIFERWHDPGTYEFYLRYRNQRIENDDYLELDKPVPGMLKVLKNLETHYSLLIVSNRDDRKNMVNQLTRFNLFTYFQDAHCAGFHGGAEGKRDILEGYPSAFLVGDTEVDIEAGRSSSVKVIAVSWGLRHKSFLRQYHPHRVAERPSQLIEFIRSRS